MQGVKHNYSYFPIFVDEAAYGMTRDELYFKLQEENIFGRRYFYPLISEFATYRGLPSAKKANLPNAHRLAESVICLPIYNELKEDDLRRVIELIKAR
jgi:dTDP-4-amino-4,6-dideoxygalactose transaminase